MAAILSAVVNYWPKGSDWEAAFWRAAFLASSSASWAVEVPTLTIVSLALRQADHMAELMKGNEI